MSKNFSKVEQHIVSLFLEAKSMDKAINYNGKQYKILIAGKPTSSKGEPKTDVYALLSNGSENIEFKISIKKDNADFLENKLTKIGAERLFGNNWSEILTESIAPLIGEFEKRILIHRTKRYKGAITLGWRFELVNKKNGKLSNEINVSAEEVYKGLLLDDDKKNAYVENQRIPNSGVAEHILFVNDISITDVETVLNKVKTIDEYTVGKKIYFACKASNYQSFKNPPEVEGFRDLSVYIDWSVENSQLKHKLRFDTPLMKNGREIFKQLENCLNILGVRDVTGLDKTNVRDCSICN
ncbi:MAG: hypothetical protein PHO27_07225 [Sulfuricurvum sp.]|nr:hypothetical protein [Sulfuricurvum sp.]